jgi:V/A-type H+-transporting ATPase subunit I
MIVKMQKTTILVQSKHSNEALRALRELGIVHVKHVHRPYAEGITALERRIEELDRALFILGDSKMPKAVENKELEKEKVTECVKEVIYLYNEKERLQNHLIELEKELAWFQDWGDVSTTSLMELEKEGVFVKLYVCRKNFLKTIPADKTIQILKEKTGNIYFVLVSLSKEDHLDLPEVKVPDRNLHTLNRRIIVAKRHIEQINARLKDVCVHRQCLLRCKKEVAKRLEFFKVKFGMAYEEGFCYLKGFCPQKYLKELSKLADKEGWAYFFEEPVDLGEVPTLIENPCWVRMIKPVFKFMGTLPGYKEFDISGWFLIFFSLFFAMLIGDAGYGVLFLAGIFLARRKFKRLPGEPFFLGYVLSIATIIWGAVTGTWFGFEKIAQIPFLNSLIIDDINSFVVENQSFMMYLCFLIGIIQLTIAHLIVAFRYINSTLALGQLGWISIQWGLFFLIGKVVLDKPLPLFFSSIMGGGIALVILFSYPGKNKIKGMLVSLGNLPLKVINSFADILSYLRLFVIGYVSVMVAASFNDMAVQIGFSSVLKGAGAALILFGGHSLNIVLGLLSVLVHGIRLNMLEFSGHLDMQWSGEEYKPFKE